MFLVDLLNHIEIVKLNNLLKNFKLNYVRYNQINQLYNNICDYLYHLKFFDFSLFYNLSLKKLKYQKCLIMTLILEK